MNAKQRKVLDEVFSQLEEIISKLEPIGVEEQEKFDNLSDNLQQTEKGRKMEENASALDEAVSNLQEALSAVDNAREEQ